MKTADTSSSLDLRGGLVVLATMAAVLAVGYFLVLAGVTVAFHLVKMFLN